MRGTALWFMFTCVIINERIRMCNKVKGTPPCFASKCSVVFTVVLNNVTKIWQSPIDGLHCCYLLDGLVAFSVAQNTASVQLPPKIVSLFLNSPNTALVQLWMTRRPYYFRVAQDTLSCVRAWVCNHVFLDATEISRRVWDKWLVSQMFDKRPYQL